MTNETEFDSEFCNVRYIENDNTVLLTWKKFARLNDYRKPTLFALDLLKRYKHSNFVIDARNGFEDDKADVEWGFSVLLPEMAKTDCRYAAFIMFRVSGIEEEMDMWTKEFGKYFAVIKAESYEQAVSKMNSLILVNVRYTVKPGKRGEFFEKAVGQGIVSASRQEPGNFKYEYYTPIDETDTVFLMEMWVDAHAIESHAKSEHYKKLQDLKSEYVVCTDIEKYNINARL